MTKTKLATAVLVLIFLLSAAYVATHIASDVDTNILSLLPGDRHNPVLSDAMQKASEDASNRVAFAIEGGTFDERHKAAERLSSALLESGLFRSSSDDGKTLWQWLFVHRTQMLCPADREKLRSEQGTVVARDAMVQWYAPMGGGSAALLKTDPLLLTNRLLGCLMPSNIHLLTHPDAEIISGIITAPVYRLDVQDRIATVVAKWTKDTAAQSLTLSRAGAIFHAAYGATHARSEMSVIGSITTFAVLLFYWMMFRSFRAPLIAVSMVVFSLTIGLAAALIIFGSIHAMALVFGAALIGMVVDYTTYYLVTGLADPDRTFAARRAQIVTPLTLGMVTSVGAFAALLFFPVPAFRQIAILGSVGLATAWAATLLLTPLVEGGAMRVGPGARWTKDVAGQFLARHPSKRLSVMVIVASIVVMLLGAWQGHTLDNVKKFQAPSTELVKEEARIRALTGFAPSSTFFLVRGETRDSATAHEEHLLQALHANGDESAVTWAASRFDPSLKQRQSDTILIRNALLIPQLKGMLASLGGGNPASYEPAEVSAKKADTMPPDFVNGLRGRSGNQYWSIVPVSHPIADMPDSPFVVYVEPAERYSELLGGYRRLATWGLVGAVALTGLMLLGYYRRLSALRILLPTMVALIVTPAITALAGLPYSFFSAMGLFLVAGAGVDYAIFQWENPGKAGSWTRVGIILAAAMTCISVGLLGLSSVLPVRSFGSTVALGVFLSLILSPFVRGWSEDAVSGEGQ